MDEMTELGASIKVVGVGGGGGNALNTMILAGLTGVDFIAANTDCQALQHNRAANKIQLGAMVTKGLGAAPIRRSAARPRWRTVRSCSPRSKARTWSSLPPEWAAVPERAGPRSSRTWRAASARSRWAW